MNNSIERAGGPWSHCAGIIELPKSQLPPGMYAVALRADGILVSTVKFISVR